MSNVRGQALDAIQNLIEYTEQCEDRIEELEEENDDLQHQIDALKEREP
jgi:chaperonin cofactor prefoldin